MKMMELKSIEPESRGGFVPIGCVGTAQDYQIPA